MAGRRPQRKRRQEGFAGELGQGFEIDKNSVISCSKPKEMKPMADD
jgi:hypothetical protein